MVFLQPCDWSEGSPELAQSQQGSPVPTFAAMAWKIVLMWGLWKGEVQFSQQERAKLWGQRSGHCSNSNGCAQLPRKTPVPTADR